MCLMESGRYVTMLPLPVRVWTRGKSPGAGTRPAQPEKLRFMNYNARRFMMTFLYVLKAVYYLAGIAAAVKKLLER